MTAERANPLSLETTSWVFKRQFIKFHGHFCVTYIFVKYTYIPLMDRQCWMLCFWDYCCAEDSGFKLLVLGCDATWGSRVDDVQGSVVTATHYVLQLLSDNPLQSHTFV